MTLPADLEPVPRDPRKLRRTAWVLVVIMVLGGVLILRYYNQWSAQQAPDERPARIHQIRKERDLRLVLQNGKTVDLFDLRGKVWVINAVALNQPEVSARSLAVMKRLAAKYVDTKDFALVTLVVDPPAPEALKDTLAAHAATHGMTLPQWWLGGNEAKTLHKFIKSELKTDTFPHQKDGQWVIDTSIVLIDREGHVRRAVVPQKQGGSPFVATFDFDLAADWDAKGVKTGTDLDNQAQLELLLEKTIDLLLAEPPEK